MNTSLRLAAAVLLIAGAATSARAQIEPKKTEAPPVSGVQIAVGGNAAALGKFLLLRDKGVQKDLKLSEDQTKKIEELDKAKGEADKNPAMIKQFSDSAAKVIDELKLSKDQSKRLDELVLQAKGPVVFMEPATQKELGIGQDQVAKLSQTVLMAMQKLHSKNVNPMKTEEMMAKVSELYKAGAEEVLKTLTEEQQKKWKMMVGTLYEGTLPPLLPSMGGMNMPGVGVPPPPPPLPKQPGTGSLR